MKLTKAQQKMREQLAPPPLLTKNQLIDWLIYHVPMEESGHEDRPFIVEYRFHAASLGWSIRIFEQTPLEAYERVSEIIMREPKVHREITDLYWYWTI